MDFESARRHLGARVRVLRLEHAMTQEALAEASGLHVSYVAQVERGERNPSLKSILQLATGLKVTLRDMFEGWS